MKSIRLIIHAISFLSIIAFLSCQSVTPSKGLDDFAAKIQKENEEFLHSDKKSGELFRVLITADEYKVVQCKNEETIVRVPDEGGDKYIIGEIDKLSIIDEVRYGVVSVWLYPDSGRIMKIRSQRPTYFKEIDALLNDDIMRWNFIFPKKVVEPTTFDIKYRIVLTKKKSDEEIIKTMQERLKEGN
ncbi:MAG: hypothetical protein KBG49_03960 [Spirochaetes bacterium]|jgi:hypothetical protein|nr:hypothetical protein [Spirochaetota bacterium]